MDCPTKELLIAMVLQHLNENKFYDAAHALERESGIFFNVKYLEEKVIAGEWEELENYLLGFTKIDDNKLSFQLFFEIKKQKYLEAIDGNEADRLLEILERDFRMFSSWNDSTFQEMSNLLSLHNSRENTNLQNYVDAQTSRINLVMVLKWLVETNPNIKQKLAFPSFSSGTLLSMFNESFNMQHSLSENWRPLPETDTLFTDHVGNPSLGVDRTFHHSGASTSANLVTDWTGKNPASLLEPSVATATRLPNLSSQVSSLKRLLPPPDASRTVDYPIVNHDQSMKRLRSALFSDEGLTSSARATASTIDEHVTLSLDDLPRNVACMLYQGSAVTSMDFHPTRHTFLLVGSANGEVTLWELTTKKKMVSKPFMICGDMEIYSSTFQAIFARNRHISVNRALWSPDGSFIGVAFDKHLIHLYAYAGSNDLLHLLEVEAHDGPVNDLAFVHPEDRLCMATCGDDKLVKVWDFNGQKLCSFEGHQAPIYSICPNQLEDIQFIMSLSIDGKIKAWVYGDPQSRVEVEAPDLWCTTLLYSDDRSRLFSCGTSKKGDPFLAEWSESDGKVKRFYHGLTKKSAGTIVHFDTTQNRFLAVGDDNQVRFWDMNKVDVLTGTYAEGGLPTQPRLRFNKEGNLLAVSTIGNGFKILATAASLRSLKAVETSPAVFKSPTAYKATSSSAAPSYNTGTTSAAAIWTSWNSILGRISRTRDSSAPVLRSSIAAAINVDNSNEEIRPASQQTITHSPDRGGKTDGGATISKVNVKISLSQSTMKNQLFWMAYKIESHPGNWPKLPIQFSASKLLYHRVTMQPRRFFVCYTHMTHCGAGLFALGSNGILAVWKWQSDEQNPGAKLCCLLWEIANLEGHTRGITGLAFSTNLNVLISSGGDGMLCAWDTNMWVLRRTVPVNTLAGAPLGGETGVRFYREEVVFLVTQKRMLAVYNASQMKCFNEWSPQAVLGAPITCATYSGDGQTCLCLSL